MENGIPLTCNVCKKSFSGVVPASQHYESEMHKKKVKAEEKMVRGGLSTSHHCDVCNIFCDTPLMLEKHKDSPRHIATVSKSKQFQNPENVMGFMQSSVQNRQEQTPNITSTNKGTEKEYIFDGSRGFCYICNIDLTSYAHCKQHLNGSKHAKTKARKNYGINSPNLHLSCNACKVVFTGPECAKQHFDSDKHKRTQQNFDLSSTATDCPPLFEYSTDFMPKENLVPLSQNGGNNNPRGINMYSALPSANVFPERKHSHVESTPNQKQKEYEFDGDKGYCFICNIELTSEPHASQHLLGQKHKKQAMKHSSVENLLIPKRPEAINFPISATETGEEYTFNGKSGYCYVCKIDLTSDAHANQHLSGKNHKKAAEQKRNMSSGNQQLYPLYCDICQKPFTGQASASQHFSSDKHREKELIKQTVDKRSGVDEDESITVTIEDTVKWYTCKICACRVNSMDQLRQHKESPKHRHQLEKNLGTKSQLQVQRNTVNVGYQKASPNVQDTRYMHSSQRGPDTKYSHASPRGPDICQPMGQFSSAGFSYSGDEQFFPSVPISEEFIDIPISLDSKLQQIHGPDADEFKRTKVYKGYEEDNPKTRFPSFDVNKSLLSGLTDNPSLDINSFNDSNILQETQLKTPYREDLDTTAGHNHDMRLNERVDEKEEPYKSLIQFDTRPGISPNVDILQFKSGFSALHVMKENENENTLMENSALYLPNPDSLPKIMDSVSNIKGQKNMENYCKQDTEKSSREIIEPEVNTDYPVMITPKTVALDTTDKWDSDQSGGGTQRTTLGSEDARATKNQPRQALSSTDATLDSEYEKFVNFVDNFENLDELSDKASKMSLNDPEDQKRPISPVTNASSSEVTLHHQLHTTTFHHNNTVDIERSDINPYRFHNYYCGTCKRPMNSEKAYKDHLQGRPHLQKIAEEKAPMNRKHPPIVKELNSYDQHSMDLTETSPRSYQVELFGKAIEKDCVCFLPTGRITVISF